MIETDRFPTEGFTLTETVEETGSSLLAKAYHLGLGRQCLIKASCLEAEKDCLKSEAALLTECKNEAVAELVDQGSRGRWYFLAIELISGDSLEQKIWQGIDLNLLMSIFKQFVSLLESFHSLGFSLRGVSAADLLIRNEFSLIISNLSGLQKIETFLQEDSREKEWAKDFSDLGRLMEKSLLGEAMPDENVLSTRLPEVLKPFEGLLLDLRKEKVSSSEEFFDRMPSLTEEMADSHFRDSDIGFYEIRSITSGLLVSEPELKISARRSRRKKRQRITWASFIASLVLIPSVVFWLAVKQSPDRPMAAILSVIGVGDAPEMIERFETAESLRLDPNQTLQAVIGAYEEVLLLDPEHERAKGQIALIYAERLGQLEDALDGENLAEAEFLIEELSKKIPRNTRLEALSTRFQTRMQVGRILKSTSLLMDANGLDDESIAAAATQSLQEVLRLDPKNTEALESLNQISELYSRKSMEASNEGRLDEAIQFLERASLANPLNKNLDSARALVARAETEQGTIKSLLIEAEQLIEEGSLISPPERNAVNRYQRVLATYPGNPAALQGISLATQQLIARGEDLLDRGDLNGVQNLIQDATFLGLSNESFDGLRNRLLQANRLEEQIQKNLFIARSLIQRGFLTEPPYANAVEALLSVQRLDSDNEEANLLLEEIAVKLASIAEKAWEAGLQLEAVKYINLALALDTERENWQRWKAEWER